MIALLQEEGTGRNLEAVSCRCAAAAALQNSLGTAQTGRTKEEAFVPERNYAAVKAKCVTGNGFDVVCQCLLHFTFPETTTNSWIFFFSHFTSAAHPFSGFGGSGGVLSSLSGAERGGSVESNGGGGY